jgi:hypothetical protein
MKFFGQKFQIPEIYVSVVDGIITLPYGSHIPNGVTRLVFPPDSHVSKWTLTPDHLAEGLEQSNLGQMENCCLYIRNLTGALQTPETLGTVEYTPPAKVKKA